MPYGVVSAKRRPDTMGVHRAAGVAVVGLATGAFSASHGSNHTPCVSCSNVDKRSSHRGFTILLIPPPLAPVTGSLQWCLFGVASQLLPWPAETSGLTAAVNWRCIRACDESHPIKPTYAPTPTEYALILWMAQGGCKHYSVCGRQRCRCIGQSTAQHSTAPRSNNMKGLPLCGPCGVHSTVRAHVWRHEGDMRELQTSGSAPHTHNPQRPPSLHNADISRTVAIPIRALAGDG